MKITHVSDGIILVDGAMWTCAKARKVSVCARSRRKIQPGDIIYRPFGNGAERMKRILASVVNAVIANAEPG